MEYKLKDRHGCLWSKFKKKIVKTFQHFIHCLVIKLMFIGNVVYIFKTVGECFGQN